jgi:hypothetical protein
MATYPAVDCHKSDFFIYLTAVFSESVLPVAFFVDGRREDQQLNMADARSFYQGMQMPLFPSERIIWVS